VQQDGETKRVLYTGGRAFPMGKFTTGLTPENTEITEKVKKIKV
jgi:hypothetical protein